MLFIKTNFFNPAYNLACEEYYYRETKEDVFMLWQNDPVVVIGKNQNLYDEVDLDYAQEQGIGVIRRITGGGAVYHDHGNVNYTFITSREKARSLDFEYFTRPIVMALGQMGVKATLSGRNDLLVDGRKISGNAQTADQQRILHHGTLLFQSDLGVLSRVLKPDPAKGYGKKIQSVRSRVANICEFLPITQQGVGDFIRRLEGFVDSLYGCRPQIADPHAVMAAPYTDKYNQEDWIYGRKLHYDYKLKKRYPFGTLVLCFNLSQGALADLHFEGDFFSLQDTRPLENALCGVTYDLNALGQALCSLEPSRYFTPITNAELLQHFFQEQ